VNLALKEWRWKTYKSDPIRCVYDMDDILTDDGIDLIAKIPPSRLYREGPEAITRELGETFEWESRHVKALFERVWGHDHGGADQVPVHDQ